mmetsp:Transcript_58326/g.132095  ORF Transcript_58326/g.132095 Transcript_58326/m.132095 type:complete len:228 (+) Transcript_58326:103-786(+)|eukprot:CAMPEP_0172584136 /NCGR_PEP_ID=MMETSP1068-20121228/3725_1 /TAXON_ID=35684 /ORGANISM="Pseudopedinella elastica, Strain CCMP716" /LENGTH=227 /DNA_ID=CAMNT_0013378217 /DNA_START=99 /DNA_END=782 /DNA_ORIENTATION=-
MGAAPSAGEKFQPTNFELADNWKMEHVRALYQHFNDGNYDFGMTSDTFARFLAEGLPNAANTAALFWKRFDTNGSGLINAVEFMSGLACMCQASTEEKADFLFELNDFNKLGSLSYDELVVLFYLAAASTVLLSGKGVLPEEQSMETIADEAFVISDIDLSARIPKESFQTWVPEFLGLSEETPTVGLREFLKLMKSLKHPKTGSSTVGQAALAELPSPSSVTTAST